MKTPVALLNLWHDRAKSLVSIGGVAFALLLVFAQLGFMGAVSYTATNVYQNLQFDLVLRSANYVHLYEASTIDRSVLSQVQSEPGVQSVVPFWVTVHNWRRIGLQGQVVNDSQLQAVAVMGVRTKDAVFIPAEVNNLIQNGAIDKSDQMIIDSFTQAPFKPMDGKIFGQDDIYTQAEIGDARFTISGIYRMGTGLAANGAVITSDAGFSRLFAWSVEQTPSLALIKLDSAANISDVKQKILNHFRLSEPTSTEQVTAVDILDRQEVLQAERYRWLQQTPIGLIFQLGVGIALVVGSAIVYMVLATDVTDRLPEYATLLAVGYSRLYLAGQVMTQAIVLALCGFGLAWILAELLYWVTSSLSGIPMIMESERIIIVLMLGILMCCFSGLLALRKLWKAEPANLF